MCACRSSRAASTSGLPVSSVTCFAAAANLVRSAFFSRKHFPIRSKSALALSSSPRAFWLSSSHAAVSSATLVAQSLSAHAHARSASFSMSLLAVQPANVTNRNDVNTPAMTRLRIAGR